LPDKNVDDKARNLVIFNASGIDIYTVYVPDQTSEAKLILESSHRLAGVVKDVAAVRFPGCKRDSLLVSFRQDTTAR
jgi:hypothetical protein